MKKPNTTMTLLLCASSIIIVANTYAQQQKQRDTISPGESMNSTGFLVSPSGSFRLGFFTPGSSQHRYLGLWYNNIPEQTVVWVANRNNPIPTGNSNAAGEVQLKLDANGTLVLTNHNRTAIYWDSDSTASAGGGGTRRRSRSVAPVACLLDTGNLQVIDRGAGNRIVWQSFDYPSDTLLPGMKMGADLRTGLDRRLTSWKSKDDPALGDVSIGVDLRGVPQIIMDDRGVPPIYLTDIAAGLLQWRTGPYNGQRFTGTPEMKSFNLANFTFVENLNDEVYFTFTSIPSYICRMVLYSNPGAAQILVWVEHTKNWVALWFAPKDRCDAMSRCGPYQVCSPNDAPPCSCIQGFRERKGNDGCVRETPKDCSNGTDGFLVLRGAKLPDTSNATLVGKGSMGVDQCATECLRNCSCTAYAAADITVNPAQSGCIIWTSDLRDIRLYANGQQDLYVRLAAKDLGSSSERQHRKKVRLMVIIPVSVLAGVALLGCVGSAWHKCNKETKTDIPRATFFRRRYRNYNYKYNAEGEGGLEDLNLPLFEFSTVVAATDCFSCQNKLGEGGFGPVYKGRLKDGQDVAIKRLARSSLQGTEEFKNEVVLIAKLQHRNLVRLLGCCIHREERMLIYEYMSNGGLDALLFDKEKAVSLDWNTRYRIIISIARGLLYLHQDSRLRIIHRDLKASNVLLDKDMTPKISDFGMARIFGGDETEINTRRVVGTYGYMSPEYAMHGIFSIKSDVFSFGVLVLEIISGMRNRGVFHAQPYQNLLGHAWSLWKDEAAMELADKFICDSSSTFEVVKCIGIGLLCVQEHPDDRPTMSSVVSMLGSDTPLLQQPKQPGFTITQSPLEGESSSGNHESDSVNKISVSMFQGR